MSKIKCPKCHKEYEGNFRYCPNCGKEIRQEVQVDQTAIHDALNEILEEPKPIKKEVSKSQDMQRRKILTNVLYGLILVLCILVVFLGGRFLMNKFIPKSNLDPNVQIQEPDKPNVTPPVQKPEEENILPNEEKPIDKEVGKEENKEETPTITDGNLEEGIELSIQKDLGEMERIMDVESVMLTQQDGVYRFTYNYSSSQDLRVFFSDETGSFDVDVDLSSDWNTFYFDMNSFNEESILVATFAPLVDGELGEIQGSVSIPLKDYVKYLSDSSNE